jgi:hypothetical protein
VSSGPYLVKSGAKSCTIWINGRGFSLYPSRYFLSPELQGFFPLLDGTSSNISDRSSAERSAKFEGDCSLSPNDDVKQSSFKGQLWLKSFQPQTLKASCISKESYVMAVLARVGKHGKRNVEEAQAASCA